MPIFNDHQKELAARIIDEDVTVSKWKDWKWQLRHAIRDIDTLKTLLEIELTPEEQASLERTTEKFPMSVTPYYLSLVDVENFRHDPIFIQSVPNPSELLMSKRFPASHTVTLTEFCFMSAIFAVCIAGIALVKERSGILTLFQGGKSCQPALNIFEGLRRSGMFSFQEETH